MKNLTLFDYGDEGKITAFEPEEEFYEVYAKVKAKDGDGFEIPCTGGTYDDEGTINPYCVP